MSNGHVAYIERLYTWDFMHLFYLGSTSERRDIEDKENIIPSIRNYGANIKRTTQSTFEASIMLYDF